MQIKDEDIDDDYNRITLAVKTAIKITSLRANIKFSEVNEQIMENCGPKIVYNGSERQNNDLRKALDSNLVGYPKNNFIILSLPKNQVNTKGQFLSLKDDLQIEENASVGIITHAYHYPRVSRMLGDSAPLNPFQKKVNVFVFLVDRIFSSPGIDEKVRNEIKKIPVYIEKGDLAKEPGSHINYKDEDSFKPLQIKISYDRQAS